MHQKSVIALSVMLICAESVESVQSQVRVSKPALVSAAEVKQCSISKTNGMTLLPQESALKSQLTSSPLKEADVTDETDTLPASS